jgi:hypothetical protein
VTSKNETTNSPIHQFFVFVLFYFLLATFRLHVFTEQVVVNMQRLLENKEISPMDVSLLSVSFSLQGIGRVDFRLRQSWT